MDAEIGDRERGAAEPDDLESPALEAAARQPAAAVWYSYAVVRVVPRVERGECLNVGVVLLARQRGFLAAQIELDADRLRALAPDADLASIGRHLDTFKAVSLGAAEGGPLAALPPAERFHWLVAPRSTVVQTSPIHEGRCTDPAATLDELLDAFVRPPRARSV